MPESAVIERPANPILNKYPNWKVIVLNDDHNTFQHVVESFVKILPGVTPDKAWALAHQIHGEGLAIVWTGPREQAEMYHLQLGNQGLTMSPLEQD